MKISVIVPVYKEEGNIPEFLRRMVPILQKLTNDFEILFAMDPSPDRTEEFIAKAHQEDPLRAARDRAGLRCVRGTADPPAEPGCE